MCVWVKIIRIVLIFDKLLLIGPHTLSFPWKYRTVSAGVNIEGCETKIAKLDDMEEGEGEVVLC